MTISLLMAFMVFIASSKGKDKIFFITKIPITELLVNPMVQ